VPDATSTGWPFDQPENCLTLTVWPILNGAEPILFVTHDEDDHGWQFLPNREVSVNEAALVCLHEIVELDLSVLEIADLPPGWQATRASGTSPWQRRVSPPRKEADD
jgi:hypothetical protein